MDEEEKKLMEMMKKEKKEEVVDPGLLQDEMEFSKILSVPPTFDFLKIAADEKGQIS